MEKYSLAVCKNDPNDFGVVSWDDFSQEMGMRGVKEAIIFAISNSAEHDILDERQLLGKLFVAPDGVQYLDEYCIIDHSQANQLLPCLVLLDPDLNYAAAKAQELWDNKTVLQWRIDSDDGRISVIERPLITPDLLSGISKNIRAAGKVSSRDVAKLFGMDHLFDENNDEADEG